jgi:hypothetical protein
LVLDFWSIVLLKLFDTIFSQNVFCSVFELPSLKNTRKRDKTKEVEEKQTSSFLSKFWKKFPTWTFCQNIFNGVFDLPLPRNAQKRTRKKSQEKKSDGGWVGLGFSKCTGRSVDLFFGGPSRRSKAARGRPNKIGGCRIFRKTQEKNGKKRAARLAWFLAMWHLPTGLAGS